MPINQLLCIPEPYSFQITFLTKICTLSAFFKSCFFVKLLIAHFAFAFLH